MLVARFESSREKRMTCDLSLQASQQRPAAGIQSSRLGVHLRKGLNPPGHHPGWAGNHFYTGNSVAVYTGLVSHSRLGLFGTECEYLCVSVPCSAVWSGAAGQHERGEL